MRRIKLTLTQYDNLSPKDIGTNYLIKNAGKLYKGENLYWSNIEEYVPPYEDYLCFTANTTNSTISIIKRGATTLNQNFLTSIDKHNWVEFIPNTTTITLVNVGDKVYFRGNNPNGVNESFLNFYFFSMTGSIAASGNIMSLVDVTCATTTIPNTHCFQSLFQGCDALTTAPKLSATILSNYCYYSMFYLCRGLIIAPLLPADNLTKECYSQMFYKCSALTTASALHSTSLAPACYSFMYAECSNLVTIPALPATTLATECYDGMFESCTSLYVSDNPIAGVAEQEWTIPTTDTFTSTNKMYYIFDNCLGSRSSGGALPGEAGHSYTYYTQNAPIE